MMLNQLLFVDDLQNHTSIISRADDRSQRQAFDCHMMIYLGFSPLDRRGYEPGIAAGGVWHGLCRIMSFSEKRRPLKKFCGNELGNRTIKTWLKSFQSLKTRRQLTSYQVMLKKLTKIKSSVACPANAEYYV